MIQSTSQTSALTIDQFRRMDYLAIEKFGLPIELMMENAGFNLARLVSTSAGSKRNVLIGVGPGNNGGGGLVAARRLAGWGFKVSLHLPVTVSKDLPSVQLTRALAFGVKMEPDYDSDVFVDAYLGFSQRLPLADTFAAAIYRANKLKCIKISMDLPTGFEPATGESQFRPDIILTLAAMKRELLLPGVKSVLHIADLGIPESIYREFGIEQPTGFKQNSLIHYQP